MTSRWFDHRGMCGLALAVSLLLAGLVTPSYGGGTGDGQGLQYDDAFRTPSSNIYCSYVGSEEVLACEILKPTYKVVVLGTPVTTSTDDRSLRGDNSAFVLGYGKTWKARGTKQGIRCTSSTSGVTCTSRDGRGFKISKSGIKTY